MRLLGLNMSLVMGIVASVSIRLSFIISAHHCTVHFIRLVFERIFVKKAD